MAIRGAVIASYAQTPVSRGHVEKGELNLTTEEYCAMAISQALDSCGLSFKDISGQGIGVSGCRGPHGVNGERWSLEIVQDLGISPSWVIRSDHGGASSLVLLMQGLVAIEAGIVDLVLCFGGGGFLETGKNQSSSVCYIEDFEIPFGMMGPNCLFASLMQRHMHLYGTRPEDTGKVVLTQRYHASLNPNAYLKRHLTMDDYLLSPKISDPIRLLDCCIPVNGAAAFVLASVDRAKGITDKPIYVKGFGYSCNPQSDVNVEMTDLLGMRLASKSAFDMASIAPNDLTFVQPYDDYSIAVLLQLESLGFCKRGESSRFIRDTDISFNGQLPINTGGGMLSGGQIGSGFVHLGEAVTQLREDAGARQIPDAETGIVTGMGGESYCGNLVNHAAVILSVNR